MEFPKKHVQSEKAARRAALLRWLVGIGICGGAIGCKLWYPQGAQAMQQIVFGRDGRSVEAAFAAFEDSYAENERFSEAVAAFCGSQD